MDKLWAVSFMSMHDNQMTIEFVKAPTWQYALAQHSKCADWEFDGNGSMEDAKQSFFDQDSMFDAKEVPNAR